MLHNDRKNTKLKCHRVNFNVIRSSNIESKYFSQKYDERMLRIIKNKYDTELFRISDLSTYVAIA